MNESNPYESPQSDPPAPSDGTSHLTQGLVAPGPSDDGPAISTANTVLPRHMAAILDNLLAFVLSIIAAKAVSADSPLLQVIVMVTAYIGYYFLSEGLTARSPGKLLTGLMVVQYNSKYCLFAPSPALR